MVSKKKFEDYLKIVRNVHSCAETYDMHVHPFDTLRPANYMKNRSKEGLFSIGHSEYKITTIEKVRDVCTNENNDCFISDKSPLMNFFVKQIYYHTGEYVFETMFDIACLDKGVLLPIPIEKTCFDNQMNQLQMMFSKNKRFYLAGSVPNSINNDEIEKYLKKQIEKFSIVALKIHPNITGIDLAEKCNKGRLEQIIDICSRYNLPIIIHGGRSGSIKGEASGYAELANFDGINFDAKVPIIISHGGTYDVPKSRIEDVIIPKLKKMLYQYNNLFVDISGLEGDMINQILRNIEIERILFGSDSLYVHPLVMQIRLIAELDKLKFSVEQSFEKVMSKNTRKVFSTIF